MNKPPRPARRTNIYWSYKDARRCLCKEGLGRTKGLAPQPIYWLCVIGPVFALKVVSDHKAVIYSTGMAVRAEGRGRDREGIIRMDPPLADKNEIILMYYRVWFVDQIPKKEERPKDRSLVVTAGELVPGKEIDLFGFHSLKDFNWFTTAVLPAPFFRLEGSIKIGNTRDFRNIFRAIWTWLRCRIKIWLGLRKALSLLFSFYIGPFFNTFIIRLSEYILNCAHLLRLKWCPA